MSKPRLRAIVVTGLVAALISGCATNPETGQREMTKTGKGAAIGAAAGAVLGGISGGDRGQRAAIGAAAGAAIGAGIGKYMQNQEEKLRQQTAGSGVEVSRQGDNVILNMPSHVTFATDSAQISPAFQSTLDQVAATIVEYKDTRVQIAGHTDSTGSESYNQQLSERRAQAVADYLASRGVDRARLSTVGYGETRPIATNETPEGRQQNRRVEIVLSPTAGG
ncbi:OmpA family protein [Immundisolibacter sp.]|uniref:OmpA family protein n=1 Tax=Immundisolibacter sp. TaxID=1934948 RepID=UPI00345860CC